MKSDKVRVGGRRRSAKAAIALAVMGVFGAAESTWAAVNSYIGDSNSSWDNASNWSANAVPLNGNTDVIFSQNMTLTVELDSDPIVKTLNNQDDALTLRLDSHTLRIKEYLWIGDTGTASITLTTGLVTQDAGSFTAVGGDHNGTLRLNNGDFTTQSSTYVGDEAGRTGLLDIVSGNSTFTTSAYMYFGSSGTGNLNITSGGDLIITAAVDTYLGYAATTNATVSGSGSRISSSTGAIYLGVYSGGVGRLTIDSGGSVTASYIAIGYDSGSVGRATVTGSGSQISSTGGLIVGSGGTGSLSVLSGATASASYANIGSAGGSGAVTVSGTGSTLSLSSSLTVGYYSSGSLQVAGGATVTAGYLSAGYDEGITGTITVTGAGSVLRGATSDYFEIGVYGNAVLDVASGGSVTAGYTSVGYASSSAGQINVGASSSLSIQSLDLGSGGGMGKMTVNGGSVSIAGGIYVASSNDSLQLNGGSVTASWIENRGSLTIGAGTFRTGGFTTNPIAGYIDNSGSVVIDRSDSFTYTEAIYSSYGTPGSLTKRGSGSLTATGYNTVSTFALEAGQWVQSGGQMWAQSNLVVSGSGGAVLNITNNATVPVGGAIELGVVAGSSGTITLASGQLYNTNAVALQYIGERGTGTVQHTGGLNSGDRLNIATLSGSIGNYNFSGGEIYMNAIAVGGSAGGADGGAGTLSMSGGILSAGTLRIFGNNDRVNFSGGQLTVGALTNTAAAADFNWTNGSLKITNSDLTIGAGGPIGSTLALTATKQLAVSYPTSAVNLSLLVSGTISMSGGSLSTDVLLLQGAGALSVSGGSLIETFAGGQATLGHGAGSGTSNLHLTGASAIYVPGATGLSVGASTAATMTVTGNSLLSAGWLRVGSGANGTLALNSGTAAIDGDLEIGVSSGAIGRVTATQSTVSAGNVHVGGTAGGAGGTGTLSVGAGAALTTYGTTTVWNTGSLTVAGGSLITGDLQLTNAGSFSWTGGSILLNGGTLSPKDGALAVPSVATLGGNGTVAGALNVNGRLSPGFSAGAMNVGSTTLTDSSTLVIELGGTGAGEYDQVTVNGSLAIENATLDLSAIDWFEPQVGDSFLIISNDGTDVVEGMFGNQLMHPGGYNYIAWAGRSFRIDYDAGSGGNDVLLTVTGVPEPAAMGVMALAGAGLLRRRRRGESAPMTDTGRSTPAA